MREKLLAVIAAFVGVFVLLAFAFFAVGIVFIVTIVQIFAAIVAGGIAGT